jgi:predicted nucleotidyltransferase component of viral defense system
MAAINFYKLTPDEKRSLFDQTGNRLSIHPAAVEKDWWVVQTLALIGQMDVSPHIVFKGGTSLSKAWNIINRFSEDIDLALDKRFLGIEECTTVKQVKKLRSATRKYIYGTFIPELAEKFKTAAYTDVKIELDEEEGRNLEPVQISVFYKSYTSLSQYNLPRVKISRHLYDIERLMNTEHAENALADKKLYNEIIQHRMVYTKISGIDYNLHQPATLNPLPPDGVMSNWEKDYKIMQEDMIYGESLPFGELIKRIKKLKEKINQTEWS